MKLVYVIGPPGIGKTTAMRGATDHWLAVPSTKPSHPDVWIPHSILIDQGVPMAVEMGVRREPFGGTDGLSMAIGSMACDWIRTKPHDLVLGEGQRLATRNFLTCAGEAGYETRLLVLSAPDEVVRDRYSIRGEHQSSPWRRGAATRVRNLSLWGEAGNVSEVVRIDASGPPGYVADEIRAQL